MWTLITRRWSTSTRIRLSCTGLIWQADKMINVTQSQIEVQQRNETVGKISATVRYDLEKNTFNLQASAEAELLPLIRQFPVPSFSATSGAIKLNSSLAQQLDKRIVTGNLLLSDFTGSYGK